MNDVGLISMFNCHLKKTKNFINLLIILLPLLQCIQLFIKYVLLEKVKRSDDNALVESTFQVNDNFFASK